MLTIRYTQPHRHKLKSMYKNQRNQTTQDSNTLRNYIKRLFNGMVDKVLKTNDAV